MGNERAPRIHETEFCGKVASWADAYFAASDSPFSSAGIEGFGIGTHRAKRKDLRFWDRTTGRLALCGEVKLPGTPAGKSPYDPRLVEDAAAKADNAGVRYFFTWNVNLFVLWDRGLWREPLLERKVRDWPLGIYLRSPEDVARPENLDYIRDNFIPKLLLELGRIYRGEQEDWPMPADDIFLRSLQSHLQWPIENTRGYLSKQSSASKEFDRHLQKWMLDQDWAFVRTDNEQWGQALDRASQTLVHVLANRLIFYQALRARFPRLPNLHMRGYALPPKRMHRSNGSFSGRWTPAATMSRSLRRAKRIGRGASCSKRRARSRDGRARCAESSATISAVSARM